MTMTVDERRIAYFSMEIGLGEDLPTYSGGLGILAGDTVRAAADLHVPMVALTLLYRTGYFYQRLDGNGQQGEAPVDWVVDDWLTPLDARATVSIEDRTVQVRAWQRNVGGVRGYAVPVYFLDVDLPENAPEDRRFTDALYGGDQRYRLAQEVILGFGGVRILRALGYTSLERFHMNEGHSSFLTLALLDEQLERVGRSDITQEDVDAVRQQCVFTTHTPVAAGHDRFPGPLVERVVGHRAVTEVKHLCCFEGELNMTFLALNFSRYVNGVARRHGEVAAHLLAPYTIDSITNGIHAASWVTSAMGSLFDRHIPGWREDSASLRYAISIPPREITDAHRLAKHELVQWVNRATNAGMDIDALTLGFARRMTTYKRPNLLFTDLDRLRAIAGKVGPFQVVYAGKAHPADEPGKAEIRHVVQAAEALRGDVRVVFLPNYDMTLGRMLTGGVDVWLNTPQAPMEASGTSGMKAAINGVPSLSIPDGWWLEGCIPGVTGWSIGDSHIASGPGEDPDDAAALYNQLEQVVMPLFYGQPDAFVDIMRHTIALNGSFFNTHRMLQQYVLKAYF